MGDVRLAREATLVGMGLSAESVGTIDQLDLLRLQIRAEQATELLRLALGIGGRALVCYRMARSTHTPARCQLSASPAACSSAASSSAAASDDACCCGGALI